MRTSKAGRSKLVAIFKFFEFSNLIMSIKANCLSLYTKYMSSTLCPEITRTRILDESRIYATLHNSPHPSRGGFLSHRGIKRIRLLKVGGF